MAKKTIILINNEKHYCVFCKKMKYMVIEVQEWTRKVVYEKLSFRFYVCKTCVLQSGKIEEFVYPGRWGDYSVLMNHEDFRFYFHIDQKDYEAIKEMKLEIKE